MKCETQTTDWGRRTPRGKDRTTYTQTGRQSEGEKRQKKETELDVLEKLTRSQRQGTQTSGNVIILSQWQILKHEGQPLNQSSGFKLLFCLLPPVFFLLPVCSLWSFRAPLFFSLAPTTIQGRWLQLQSMCMSVCLQLMNLIVFSSIFFACCNKMPVHVRFNY